MVQQTNRIETKLSPKSRLQLSSLFLPQDPRKQQAFLDDFLLSRQYFSHILEGGMLAKKGTLISGDMNSPNSRIYNAPAENQPSSLGW